jgi:DNA-binding LytR/AlgR family response regulator
MSLSSKVLFIHILTPDQPLQHLLTMLLLEINVKKVTTNNNFQEAISAYNQEQPDICIIDAGQFPKGQSGVDFATSIREKDSQIPVVFLVESLNDASYDRVKTFDQSSVLSKEPSKMKLLQAVKYAMLQLENSKLIRQLSEHRFFPEQPHVIAPAVKNEQQLFFKIGDSFRAIEKEKISFFFADNKLTYARVGKRNFPTSVQLKTLEHSLSPSFLRCHKKYILSVSHIESISMKDSKVKINEELLPIGYSYRKSFLEGLNLLK